MNIHCQTCFIVIIYINNTWTCLQVKTAKDGNTPLHTACIAGKLETVKLLTSITKCDQEAINHHVRTPLHLAVIHCRPVVVRYLLSKFDNEKNTGLDEQLMKDLTSKRETAGLMNHIARSTAPIDPNRADFLDWTPMHYAVDNSSLACAKALLTKGNARLVTVTGYVAA